MYDFEMSPHSGNAKQSGAVLRLYPGQDFFIQILSLVRNQSVVIANLPSTFRGEYSTGIGVITLTEVADRTFVNLTMGRRYVPVEKGAEAMKTTRASGVFANGTRATWNRFLGRLKSLSETS